MAARAAAPSDSAGSRSGTLANAIRPTTTTAPYTNSGRLVLARPTAAACNDAKVRKPPSAAIEVKKPIDTGTAFQWINRGGASRSECGDRVSPMPSTISAARTASTPAPNQAAAKPAVLMSSSPSGGPNDRPRYNPSEL